MPAAKVAITIEEQLLKRIDRLVAQRKFPNRSRRGVPLVSVRLKPLISRPAPDTPSA